MLEGRNEECKGRFSPNINAKVETANNINVVVSPRSDKLSAQVYGLTSTETLT
jgi:hypothetical protein